jgi:glycosyltransferase involved in cell wall biosynthesis
LYINKKLFKNIVINLIMEHISQLTAEIRDETAQPDILVISRIFLPKEAVIGEYMYNRCLQDPGLNTPTHVINPVIRPEKFGNATLNSLDNLRIRVRQIYNIPETSIVILSVGRLLKHKGFDRVIDNIPLLLTFGVDVHYILCGEGSCESQLKSLAHRLRVNKRVHFAGYIPEKELAGYYAACDIFAMLSLLDTKPKNMEGFGIVYLEASYFGKPIIAPRLGGILDTVQHEENGILVNPNSGYEVFKAFNRLCKDQQLREQLGRKGKELAKRRTLHRSLYTALTAAMRYILKSESFDRRGQGEKLYCIIAGSAVKRKNLEDFDPQA